MSDDTAPDAPRGPHTPSPRKPRDDYWEFINLSGKIERVDPDKLGCPLTARRFEEDGVSCCEYREEYLYPAPGSRYILIFLPDYDPELVPLPWACPWPAASFPPRTLLSGTCSATISFPTRYSQSIYATRPTIRPPS